jgi:hypothetical protein
MPSIFMPKAGMAQEWITSAAVTRRRISSCMGTTMRLSTSKRRNSPGFRLSVGIIYESYSTDWKSEYSYLQYHWCPIALILTEGCLNSSVRYRSRRDGRARNRRVTAGRIVQIVSTCWASVVKREVYLLNIKAIRA